MVTLCAKVFQSVLLLIRYGSSAVPVPDSPCAQAVGARAMRARRMRMCLVCVYFCMMFIPIEATNVEKNRFSKQKKLKFVRKELPVEKNDTKNSGIHNKSSEYRCFY